MQRGSRRVRKGSSEQVGLATLTETGLTFQAGRGVEADVLCFQGVFMGTLI